MASASNLPPDPAYQEEAPAKPSQQKPKFGRDPVTVLQGQQADVYVDMLCKLVRGGRANRFFPNPKGMENLFHFMAPSATFGLEQSLRLNLRTGLPDEPEMGKVTADREIAERFLHQNDFPELAQRTDDASIRLLKRVRYYRELARCEVPQRLSLNLRLRRVEDDRKTAFFEAVFQRYDPGEGVFTRYTILLSHRHQRWSQPQVELQGDDLRYTESFRNVISRYSSDEAEFAFVLLSNVPNIAVEEVVRGRIGPLWMDGVQVPAEIQEMLSQHPGNFILNFPQERVAVPENPEGKTDSNRDPFARFYRESLDPASRALADKRAEELGYIIHKERKFSCTPGILQPLRDLLAQRNMPCVIYPTH